MTAKPKPLRCWNGTLHGVKHVYVCAHSRADASRLICEAYRGDPAQTSREMKDYFSECWGTPMKDITPERGIWVVPFYGAQPSRVI